MAQLGRFRVTWGGLIGGPGLSTYYFDVVIGSPQINSAWQAYYTAIRNYFPPNVQWQFPSTYDTIDETNGDLVSSASMPQLAPISGNGSGNYSAPNGLLVKWSTADVVHNHRVSARHFLVPVDMFEDTPGGTPSSSAVSAIQAAAGAFVTTTSPHYLAWSRPFKGTPATPTRPANPARLGSSHQIIGAIVPPKFVVLRGRRDT